MRDPGGEREREPRPERGRETRVGEKEGKVKIKKCPPGVDTRTLVYI